MITIRFKVRGLTRIFEKSFIGAAFKRTTKSALRGFGAYVRAIARNSLGKGDKKSKPGSPPTSRTKFLKNSIQFGVDERALSVVIGPVKRPGVAKSVTGLVPPLLEYGGTTMWLPPKERRRKRVMYRARPFMRPGFAKGLPKLPEIWERAKKR